MKEKSKSKWGISFNDDDEANRILVLQVYAQKQPLASEQLYLSDWQSDWVVWGKNNKFFFISI